VHVVSKLFDEVDVALKEAQEKIASLASAKANHEAATTALTEAAAALGSVAARMTEVIDEQRTLQTQLQEQTRQFLAATAQGPDLSALSRLEQRLEAIGEMVERSMSRVDSELDGRLAAIMQRLDSQDEAVVGAAKKANAHVTTKIGAVLGSVQSYGDQIYELTAALHTRLIAEANDGLEGESPAGTDDVSAPTTTILPSNSGEVRPSRLFRRSRG